MAEQARGKSPAAGWLTTLLGAGILIVLGFMVGLVAGAVFEEPDLVMDHLAGRTDVVPVPDGEPGPEAGAEFDAGVSEAELAPTPEPGPVRAERPLGAPRVAAQPPPPPPAPRAVPEPEAASAVAAPSPVPPPAPLPAVSARQPGFAIQVGAFGERSAAEALIAGLRGDRHPAYLVSGAPEERVRYRVRVGPYPTRDEAQRVAKALEKKRGLPTWVLTEDGS